jgi:hypothetical protein
MKVIKDTPLMYTKLDIYMKVIKDTPLAFIGYSDRQKIGVPNDLNVWE